MSTYSLSHTINHFSTHRMYCIYSMGGMLDRCNLTRSSGGIFTELLLPVITFSSKTYWKLWVRAPKRIRVTPTRALLPAACSAEVEVVSAVTSAADEELSINIAVNPTRAIDSTLRPIPV